VVEEALARVEAACEAQHQRVASALPCEAMSQ